MIYVNNIDSKASRNLYKVDFDMSLARNPYQVFSPFYHHKNIPIVNTSNSYSDSLYDIWYKLYSGNTSHFRKGLYMDEYVPYHDAIKLIFIPTYCWILENKVYDIVEELRKIIRKKDILINDYRPLKINKKLKMPSCAALLRAYIEGRKPYSNSLINVTEEKQILLGRKDITIKHTSQIPQKICKLYTDQQYRLDFEY